MSKSMFLGVELDEFFVFGHTHIPNLDKDNKWGNACSWITNEREYGTFIEIGENEIVLDRYPDMAISKISL